ncbi:MAG TPA: MarR family transcriptional regulator [Polyangia bacterium]|nr:MarR family transcriptional regulator [Polyangia bacterium]
MHSTDAAGAYGVMALDAIRKLVRVLGESARLAQGRTGISGAQLFVLRVLAEHPGLSINQLAEQTMTHQSSVSVVVSRLAARGLVARAPAPDDRRRQLVTLTPRGRALRRSAPAVAQEVLVQAIRGLPPARRRALATSLRALTDALGVSDQTAPMFFEEDDRVVTTRRRRSGVTVHA